MSAENVRDVSPESLMSGFHGRGIMTIAVFAVVVHIAVIGGSSVPYLMRELLGEDTSGLSQEERIEKAVEEAGSALRRIADRHGVNPQDLSDRFRRGGRAAKAPDTAPPAEETPEAAPDTAETPTDDPEKPKSAIEKQLEVKEQGPALPPMDDDIF